jgi:hypothetical protein
MNGDWPSFEKTDIYYLGCWCALLTLRYWQFTRETETSTRLEAQRPDNLQGYLFLDMPQHTWNSTVYGNEALIERDIYVPGS